VARGIIRRVKNMNKRTSFLCIALLVFIGMISIAASNVVRSSTYFRAPVDFSDVITLHSAVKSRVGAGTAATGASVVEYGGGDVHKSVFTFNKSINVANTDGASGYASFKFYDFPVGNVLILGAVADLDGTSKGTAGVGIIGAADGDFGFGTTACNAGALATTEQDIIPTTALAQFADTTGPIVGANTDIATFNGTSTAKDLYLNVIFDDADCNGTDQLIVTGTATVWWINLGDY
jgi:hypothetical protein